MSDTPPLLPVPPGRSFAPSRQYRSTSGSPTRQRPTDDLLSQLSPEAALQALRSPSGPLKRCMDAATPSEQSFAMRAAIASKNIRDWVDELSTWRWATESNSAGFEPPDDEEGEDSEVLWMGSMLAADVVRYDKRIDAIQRDMVTLDVEEIKTHILHHHIIPLSRPGTPMSDSNQSTASSTYFNKMDDLTAVVTAVVLHALPDLSKLMRLMNTWSVRLLVLKRVPDMLAFLANAEIAIQAGWDGLKVGGQEPSNGDRQDAGISRTLTRKDFQIMKLVIEKKIARAAQTMDYLLNLLDGRTECIPEPWIDRLDRAEAEYSEWVAACETNIREADWRKMTQEKPVLSPPIQQAQILSTRAVSPKRKTTPDGAQLGHQLNGSDAPKTVEVSDVASGGDSEDLTDDWELLTVEDATEPSTLNTSNVAINIQPAEDNFATDGIHTSQQRMGRTDEVERLSPVLQEADQGEEEEDISGTDGVGDPTTLFGHPILPVITGEWRSSPPREAAEWKRSNEHGLPSSPSLYESPTVVDEGEATITLKNHLQPEEDHDLETRRRLSPRSSVASLRSQPSLPSLREVDQEDDDQTDAAKASQATASEFDLPSDLPEPEYMDTPELPWMETPEFPRVRDAEMEVVPSDDIGSSPPSSPPNHRYSIRSLMTVSDMPTVTEVPDAEDPGELVPPKTPLESSFADDAESPRDPRDVASPSRSASRMSVNSEDDQLQQQISEILESIPAKIHLSSKPSTINHLNPPEFQPPTRAKATKPVDTVRSYSSMSSRAGTPSFLLAPAYSRNPRPRQSRGNQEIKLYHLSRSTGEAPIKLFIRLVGENGERVMVRVGGGWADLGEYLKEYASHHGRRSKSGADAKIEVRDLPPLLGGKAGLGMGMGMGAPNTSSPPSRPPSALDSNSPMTPLGVRKTRGAAAAVAKVSEDGSTPAKNPLPRTPLATAVAAAAATDNTPSSGASTRSRSSSRLSWTEEDSSLGMSGPRTKNVEMSDESRAWVASVKEKVRLASGERKPAFPPPPGEGAPSPAGSGLDGKFGEMGKVGGTKRLFRKG